MECRSCHDETGDEALCDLGVQPMANDLRPLARRYPLRPVICQRCGLVQLPFFENPFTEDYPFRSGQSETWKLHLRTLIDALGIRAGDRVIEVGGNDGTLGTLLPHGTTYINIDPTAEADGHTVADFLTAETHLGFEADYVIALNVLAHVPDLDDFCAGLFGLVKRTGTVCIEVPSVEQLILTGAWDTIYHEHLSYFSKSTLLDVMERRGFYADRVPRSIPTHGGSLRATFGRRAAIPRKPEDLRRKMPLPAWDITPPLDRCRWAMLFGNWQRAGKRVVGYGAPAKASTFLNYLAQDFAFGMDYIVDSTPEKWGKVIPGVLVLVQPPEHLSERPADIVIILAWNYADEIVKKIPEGPEVWARGERMR